MKLFIEDIKGYIFTETNVKRIKIAKQDKKNVLIVETLDNMRDIVYPLSRIKLAYMIDSEFLYEYFRYSKDEI